ncbi:hypothetical protein OAS43_00195 [Candidatus Pelagibacter sp.]|nr:hypothetical protein [Candidatus Pelagibacter sp.]
MKIFDCTTFFDEKMMMDLRFNVLNDYVEKFVVIESTFSHSGEKKKLNFEINDYPKFKDKINYIVIDKEPQDIVTNDLQLNPINKRLNSIKRIEQSYNFMMKGLSNITEDDLVMISDNDEIPNLELLNSNTIKNDFIIFKQLFFYYRFNLLYDRMSWFGTKACKMKNLKTFSNLRNIKNKKYPFWRLDVLFSDLKKINLKIVENGGWHFTNLKTPEELFKKFRNFGHYDEFELSGFTIDKLREKINKKEVFYDHFADKNSISKWNFNYKLKKIDDQLLPIYLNKNRNRFKEWFD